MFEYESEIVVNGNSFALKAIRLKLPGENYIRDIQLREGKEWGMFLKLTDADGLWSKIKNHVGVKVKHPVSPASRELRARINDPGVKKTSSVCPYCAVGCSTLVYSRDGRIIDVEGNPDSPINAGTLCPKGSAIYGLMNSPYRWTKVRYRRPYSDHWEDLSLDEAMDMIADRVKKTRDETFEETDEEGRKLNRSLAVASIGGATIDNEENYLITKLFHSMGFVRITNQARI
jgi:formate dehydrogenase major subunit